MGNQLSSVATKIGDHPPKCLADNIDVRQGSPERFFLIPITPTTMPTPQSPLCVMLTEALSAPSAVHWAWPPAWNVETPYSGVADSHLASSEASRAVPRAEQTFAHAVPRQGTSPQNPADAAAVELGHLLSLVAVACPVDCPISHRADRAAPQGQGEDASIFFDFSAEWLESIYKMEGCAVVGYFRYLNLLDLPSPVEHVRTTAVATRATVPIVSVIDHYLFKGFCYEARAFMLLESVSFYCKRFANLYGSDRIGVVPSKRSWRHRPPVAGATCPLLLRCRATNLPILRLFQKLYRVHVREPPPDDHHCSEINVEHRLSVQMEHRESRTSPPIHLGASQGQLEPPRPPAIHLMECGQGEILHIYLSPALGHLITTKLSERVSIPRKGHPSGTCTLRFGKPLRLPTPTPLDALIERHRDRWLAENAPFRKHTGTLGPPSDGEESTTENQEAPDPSIPQPRRLRLPAPGNRRDNQDVSEPHTFSKDCNEEISRPTSTSVGAGHEMRPADEGGPRKELSPTSRKSLLPPPAQSGSVPSIKDGPSPSSLPRTTCRPEVVPSQTKTLPVSSSGLSGNSAEEHPRRRPSCSVSLPVGTPIQASSGDGIWNPGYWLEASRPVNLHLLDPSSSEVAWLLLHGPIWMRGLVNENRLIPPASTGSMYIVVAPNTRVFLSANLEGEPVEVRHLFERHYRTTPH
jgi:hypothetical protein